MGIDIVVSASPSQADYDMIQNGLVAFNESQIGAADYEPVAILLHDTESGHAIGGLWAEKLFKWLYIEMVFVPEQARKQDLGSALLAKAEELARHKGCLGVWLDTFSFQAPEFYKKLGYQVFGTINDYPPGSKRYFLNKRF